MKTIIKFFDKIILVLLGIVGAFSGCKPDCDFYEDVPFSSLRYPEGSVLYGMPPAVYVIKGDVKSKSGKPIPNIRIIAEKSDTVFTDSKGKYIYKFDAMVSGFHFTIEDIDGLDNGGYFKSQEMDVQFTDADLMNNGDCGNFYVKTANVKLEKSKDEFIPLYGVKSAPFKP
jgi:putative lipoprotein (rSAM/lipoprotein system)